MAKGTKGTASASNKRQLALANEDDQETSSSTSNNNKGQGKAPAVSSNKKARLDKSVVSKSKQSEVLRKAVRDLLKDLASDHLNEIDDEEERQQAQQGLSTLVKSLLSKLKEEPIPKTAVLASSHQSASASSSKSAKGEQKELKELQSQINQARKSAQQEATAFKHFRKSRHEVEAIEREEQASKLHPLVKELYPEMGSTNKSKTRPLVAEESLSGEEPWLRDILVALESRQQASQEDEEVDPDLYDPDEDDWLKKYSEDLLQHLGKFDRATLDLDMLGERVIAASSILDV